MMEHSPEGARLKAHFFKHILAPFATICLLALMVAKVLDGRGASEAVQVMGFFLSLVGGIIFFLGIPLYRRYMPTYLAQREARQYRAERGWRRHEKKIQRLREQIDEGELVIGEDGEIVSIDEIQKKQNSTSR
jgi:hypothetical protein